MIHSNSRKLLLSGWLKENGKKEYDSPLKLQKFLLFYEALEKVNGGTADFSHLKGYQRGPVFSNVWGDYTYERSAFDEAVEKEYAASRDQVVEKYAKKSQFLVSVLSENDLSALTHKLNMWKTKESKIMQGERQVELLESDFNENDAALIGLLDKMYPMSLIDDTYVVELNNYYFLFSKHDASRLSAQHFDVLSALCDGGQLRNPVYAEIDEEGRIIID